ncbi:MAG: ATP-dependent 6-phosphofructokinase [Deltaproteobacteria bacterium]|jgi:6-phosphofructokinase 1|nr:ATP-dependent 6-phosphofructokinase [Deltaproteobacteria bacterium]
MLPTSENTKIQNFGECTIESPIAAALRAGQTEGSLVSESEKIRYRVEINQSNPDQEDIFFEKAGPREKIFFNPAKTTAAIVTCGGVSPGLNNVIRSIVLELYYNYGVKSILGFQYGYLGFTTNAPAKPIGLTPEIVKDINKLGGSFIGSSRGPVDAETIIDTLVRYGIDILFTVGGDGTQRGAQEIVAEAQKRNAKVSIIGIPKTIDNDILYVYQTFGFATAVEQAKNVITCAAVEATSYQNTISIVKLMGRDAGFIAAMSTIAAIDVDFCLIPEVPFNLEGEAGFYALVENKLRDKGSAVIVVSEGAGQEFFENLETTFDISGNRQQHDIGAFLKSKLSTYFKEKKLPITLRYFDPSYSIRSVPANVSDSLFCDRFARAAVHAGMCGKTNMMIGFWYNNVTHIPLSLLGNDRKRINPSGGLWGDVLSITGQPPRIGV